MNTQKDVFDQMKNEDRKFGERTGKVVAAKHSVKREKHPVAFKNYNMKDIMALSEDFSDDLVDAE